MHGERQGPGSVAVLVTGTRASVEAALGFAALVAGDGPGSLLVLARRPLLPWGGQPAIGVLPAQVAAEHKSRLERRVELLLGECESYLVVSVVEIGIPVRVLALRRSARLGCATLVVPRPRGPRGVTKLLGSIYRRIAARSALRVLEPPATLRHPAVVR